MPISRKKLENEAWSVRCYHHTWAVNHSNCVDKFSFHLNGDNIKCHTSTRMTDSQKSTMTSLLRNKPKGKLIIYAYNGAFDSKFYADEIAEAVRSSEWNVTVEIGAGPFWTMATLEITSTARMRRRMMRPRFFIRPLRRVIFQLMTT